MSRGASAWRIGSGRATLPSGGSDLQGYDLNTEVCRVSNSGGSDVHISVSKELSVFASGGSDVYYKGACSVKQVSSGGSDVIKKG